jgi:multicomponent Na+:H+ antiporter subunit G
VSVVLDVLSWVALLAGGFFAVVSAAGMLRMPDLFTRMHAVSVNDTLGVGLLTLGMLLQTGEWAVAVRLVIILVVLYATGTVTVHALARAALHDGQRPLLAGTDGQLRPTDIAALYPDLAFRVAHPLVSEQVEDRPALPAPAPGRAGATGPETRDREDPQWNS